LIRASKNYLLTNIITDHSQHQRLMTSQISRNKRILVKMRVYYCKNLILIGRQHNKPLGNYCHYHSRSLMTPISNKHARFQGSPPHLNDPNSI
jgi:hypothetical protein